MKDLVVSWFQAGAPFKPGGRLFMFIAGVNHPYCVLLGNESSAAHTALKIALSRRAGIALPCKARTDQKYTVAVTPVAPVRKLREDWPFLQDPACMPEMKILAANKITAYHNYVSAHDALFDCTSPLEQLATVSALVSNYIENRSIIKEFVFYKEHGHPLGEHPVFREFKIIKELRKLNIVDLLKMKEKLEHNIWRIESEIRKGQKKHLASDRKQRLQEKRNLSKEVERLIKEFK